MLSFIYKLFFKKTSSPLTKLSHDEFLKKIDGTFKQKSIIQYDISSIMNYINWSFLVYTDQIVKKDVTIHNETGQTPFYIIHSTNDELIISIRGTQTGKDIEVDLDTGGIFSEYHKGMMDVAVTMLIDQDLLNKWIIPSKKCVIVGHSLGAGIAVYVLLCIRLYYPEIKNIHVYTFGCPSIIPSKYINLLNPYMTNIVNKRDVISTFPPTLTWVSGGEQMIHLTEKEIIQRHWSYFKRVSDNYNIFDHSLNSYLSTLNNLSNES
jgi:predicted lipase